MASAIALIPSALYVPFKSPFQLSVTPQSALLERSIYKHRAGLRSLHETAGAEKRATASGRAADKPSAVLKPHGKCVVFRTVRNATSGVSHLSLNGFAFAAKMTVCPLASEQELIFASAVTASRRSLGRAHAVGAFRTPPWRRPERSRATRVGAA
eukprot:1458738-Prymnesium_polylepis.2